MKYWTLFLLLSVQGCAVNGEHIFVGDNCVSCWNDPVTGEPINYSKEELKTSQATQTQYEVINWHSLMLEGLSRSRIIDFSKYGEDYLNYHLGGKKINEVTYQNRIKDEVIKLEKEVDSHKIQTFQFTNNWTKIGNYDFEKKLFPIEHITSVTTNIAGEYQYFPNKIIINFINSSKLPQLKMNSRQAESFLKSRSNSHWVYVRYIFRIIKMNRINNFDAVVTEVQYIDRTEMTLPKTRERFVAFQKVKIVN